jgi:hypothetical protein
MPIDGLTSLPGPNELCQRRSQCTSGELLTKDLIEVDIRHDLDALCGSSRNWGCAVGTAGVNKKFEILQKLLELK